MTFDEQSWASNRARGNNDDNDNEDDDNNNDNDFGLRALVITTKNARHNKRSATQLKTIQVDNDMWIVTARKELLLF